MRDELVRCTFGRDIAMHEVEATLALALVSAQAIHGEARTRLEIDQRLDRKKRICEIDASTEPGETLTKLFVGLITREFGASGFALQRFPLPRSRQRHAKNKPIPTTTPTAV